MAGGGALEPVDHVGSESGPGPAPTELVRLEAHLAETIIAPFSGRQPYNLIRPFDTRIRTIGPKL